MGLSVRHNLLDAGIVSLLRERDVRTYAWIVHDRRRAEEILGWGVDGLIADDYEMLAAVTS